MGLKATTRELQWFSAGFEVRELPGATAGGTRSIRLWLGAHDRAEAVRMATAREVGLAGRAARGRRISARRPLSPLAPTRRRTERLHPELAELAARPWAIVEGCLVQVTDDADVIAAEWLEATDGDVTMAEQSLNRMHLWDTMDEDEGEPATEGDDLAAAMALARSWQRDLARVAGAERIVIELCSSADGPELTVFRWDVAGAA